MNVASSKFSLEKIAVKAGLYFRSYLFVMDFADRKNKHACLLLLCTLDALPTPYHDPKSGFFVIHGVGF